jgi:hypothetical protein
MGKNKKRIATENGQTRAGLGLGAMETARWPRIDDSDSLGFDIGDDVCLVSHHVLVECRGMEVARLKACEKIFH